MIIQVQDRFTLLMDLDEGNEKWPMKGEVVVVQRIEIDTDDMVPQIFVSLTTDRLDTKDDPIVARPHFGPVYAYDFKFFFAELSEVANGE
jgi:hypothetical protein